MTADVIEFRSSTPDEMRAKAYALESAAWAERSDDIVTLATRDHFSPGVYARELFIPKGATVVGKTHKYAQLNIMSAGELSVLTEDGVKRVKAPFIIVSPAGTKRVAYAHEDTVWVTIHGTDETDVDKIEAHFVAQTEAEYLAFCEQLKIGSK